MRACQWYGPPQPAEPSSAAPALGVMIGRRLPDGYRAEALRADALAGLTSHPKHLPPKWLYDKAGSELFDQITRLDAYYLTRAERAILVERSPEIAAATRAQTLVDLGCGSAAKTRLLLSSLRAAGTLQRYVALDVSEPALVGTCRRMLEEYPGISTYAVVSDFERDLGLPSGGAPRLIAFLGSTIGNLPPPQRAAFLASARAVLRPGDAFLLGTDLVKDPAVLLRAYDDAAGLTAQFNRNVLAMMNRELGAGFDLTAFRHVAVWDEAAEWIEMRLRAMTEQVVKLTRIGLTVTFAAGEELRTEISAKFRRDGVEAELDAAGLELRAWWTDEHGRFGLSLSEPR